jgi:hypothetical protein
VIEIILNIAGQTIPPNEVISKLTNVRYFISTTIPLFVDVSDFNLYLKKKIHTMLNMKSPRNNMK